MKHLALFPLPLPLLLFLILVLVHPLILVAHAAHNVTIDDSHPSIVYTPPDAWHRSADTPLNINGSHMLTQDPAARAVFKFNGTAVYFLSPLWPYNVTTLLTLDARPPVLVNLVDRSRPNVGSGPESVAAGVVWGVAGLEEGREHTLVVAVGRGEGYAILDGVMYTDPNDAPPPATTTAVSTDTTSTTQTGRAVASPSSVDSSVAEPAQKQRRIVPIVLGTLFGLLALGILIIAMWYCWRKRQRPVSEAWTNGDASTLRQERRGAAGWYVAEKAQGGVGAREKRKRASGERGRVARQQQQQQQGRGLPMTPAGTPGYGYGYYMRQGADGRWENPHYGYVGGEAPANGGGGSPYRTTYSPGAAGVPRMGMSPPPVYAYPDAEGYYQYPQNYGSASGYTGSQSQSYANSNANEGYIGNDNENDNDNDNENYTYYTSPVPPAAASSPPAGPATSPQTVDPHTRAPNRYQPGNTLSTITEKSTPQMPGSGGVGGTKVLPPGSPESAGGRDIMPGGWEGQGQVHEEGVAPRRADVKEGSARPYSQRKPPGYWI